jgi:hypothetical protein
VLFTSGLPETRCGLGSTLRFTVELREALPKLFCKYNVRSLLDAPCGDFNWMAQTDLSGIEYIGCDYDPANIRIARSRAPQFIFCDTDIVHGDLPNCDMILCRDFFQHVPYRAAAITIDNFKSTNANWLVATSHRGGRNEEAGFGEFFPINLSLSPFNFPEPLEFLPDGDNRILGVWDMDTI